MRKYMIYFILFLTISTIDGQIHELDSGTRDRMFGGRPFKYAGNS